MQITYTIQNMILYNAEYLRQSKGSAGLTTTKNIRKLFKPNFKHK